MKKKKIYPSWFLIIPVVLYGCFFLLPSILGIAYSFTDWSLRSAADGIHFVGLENYKELFTSDVDYTAGIQNTVMFTVVSNIVKLVPALLLAVMLQEKMRGRGIYRTILYLSSVIPFVVVGIIFRSIFNYQNGLLNAVLEALHLGSLKQKWLSDLQVVWGSIIGVDAWRGIGYCMTIFLAGLQTIPQSMYDAAKIDGAGFWQRMRYVILPMLSGSIMINLVFGITCGLNVFDIVYVMTNGGPGHATEVVSTYVFQLYSKGNYGISAALSTLLLIVTAIIGVTVIRVMSKKEVQQ